MNDSIEHNIDHVLNQGDIPVVRLDSSKTVFVKLPYAYGNRNWIRDYNIRKPHWHPDIQSWDIPRSWFSDIVDRCLRRFGKVYVIQPYRVQEKCAPSCWHAEGHECHCSCMGANHGTQNPAGNWFIVSDTFAFNWSNGNEASCRLLINKSGDPLEVY